MKEKKKTKFQVPSCELQVVKFEKIDLPSDKHE